MAAKVELLVAVGVGPRRAVRSPRPARSRARRAGRSPWRGHLRNARCPSPAAGPEVGSCPGVETVQRDHLQFGARRGHGLHLPRIAAWATGETRRRPPPASSGRTSSPITSRSSGCPAPRPSSTGSRTTGGRYAVAQAGQRQHLVAQRAEHVLRLRPERDVHLQRAGQQEDAEPGARAEQVDVVDGAGLGVHPLGPVRDDIGLRPGHRQRAIDVGPAVLAIQRGRAGEGCAADPRIRVRRLDQRCPQRGSFGDGEHDAQHSCSPTWRPTGYPDGMPGRRFRGSAGPQQA